MKKNHRLGLLVLGMLCLGSVGARAQAQYPIMDRVAQRVIAKYQTSSCEQLANKRTQPPTPEEQRVVQFLRNDPQMRAAFIDRVAAPIANKLFECGLIP